MHRSKAPLTDWPAELRAEVRYSASARIAVLIACVRAALIGLGLAYGGDHMIIGFLVPGPCAGPTPDHGPAGADAGYIPPKACGL